MGKYNRRYYLDKIEQLEKPLGQHLEKLEAAKKAGGYTSSIETEIRAWREKKKRYEGRT
ncbi:MAG TPA: hypothetical protein VKM55_16420 [Candidatus Lokiarchaeia archaeon]|nr:hypothetical protein [Candidatus Lokiarchaeia archaeon]